MIAYALPTPNGRVLWVPGPNRWAWGELKGLGSRITVLSPDPDLDISELPLKFHDNLYRPTVRKMFSKRYRNSWLPRAMLWGFIWLIGRSGGESVLEGIVWASYLIVGLPFFYRLSVDTMRRHAAGVLARFNELFYAPDVEVVYSKRLDQLEFLLESEGIIRVLERLDELGLMHLREFYRRCAWASRWPETIGPPTGQGVLDA